MLDIVTLSFGFWNAYFILLHFQMSTLMWNGYIIIYITKYTFMNCCRTQNKDIFGDQIIRGDTERTHITDDLKGVKQDDKYTMPGN